LSQVSTGSRFTFYELELNPENKMQYIYDGEIRDIDSRTVSAQNLQADGSVETVEHTFYLSHYGPIVGLGTVSPLVVAGIAMDVPWGEVQFDEKNGTRYGLQGGSGSMMFSVITSNLVDGEGYADIFHGNSYIQAVTWDESDCPDAYAQAFENLRACAD